MKPFKYKTTNYRQAWIKYRKSNGYKQVGGILRAGGIRQPWRDNIIQDIFSSGWLASGKDIHWIEPQ